MDAGAAKQVSRIWLDSGEIFAMRLVSFKSRPAKSATSRWSLSRRTEHNSRWTPGSAGPVGLDQAAGFVGRSLGHRRKNPHTRPKNSLECE